MKQGVFFLLLLSMVGYGQEYYSRSVSFINDNDLYVSTINDKYYTNGMFLSFQKLTPTRSSSQLKRITSWTIAHQMYTPFKPTVKQKSEHDRPFAAYFYVGHNTTKVYASSLWTSGFEIGILGPYALGEELQNIIHDLYNYDRPLGWEYQIRNTFGLQYQTSYIGHLGYSASKLSDINGLVKLQIGTIFTELTTGFYGRIGFTPIGELSNTSAFNTNLSSAAYPTKRPIETFLYYRPTLSYVVYDATIQGGLFNDRSPVTFPINRLRFDLEFGLLFTMKRYQFGYALHYYTNKLQGLRYPNGSTYGRIQFRYLMK